MNDLYVKLAILSTFACAFFALTANTKNYELNIYLTITSIGLMISFSLMAIVL